MIRALALALFSASAATAHELPESLEDLAATEVADGVWVIHGMADLPDPENLGFMSNIGAIATEDGLVLIDSGGSDEVARRALEALVSETDLPVRLVVNTHLHGDHWLGNAEIAARYPEASFAAHAGTVQRLEAGEGDRWERLIGTMIGRDLDIRLPDRPLEDGDVIALGSTTLRFHHTGRAHTGGDLMIEDVGRRVLFGGDIVEYRRVPSVDVPEDASIRGQMAALDHVLALEPEVVVPGHGPSGGIEVARATRDFLGTIWRSVSEGYEAGRLDYEMKEDVVADLSDYADWYGMDGIGRLISVVWLEVEAAFFE